MLCADLGSNCLADTWFSSFYFVSFWSTNPQEKTGKDTGSIVSSQPTLYLLGEGIKKRYHPWIQHELALSWNHTEKTKRDPEWQIAEGPEGRREQSTQGQRFPPGHLKLFLCCSFLTLSSTCWKRLLLFQSSSFSQAFCGCWMQADPRTYPHTQSSVAIPYVGQLGIFVFST